MNVERINTEQRGELALRPLWRVVESRLVRSLVDDATFDFYARVLNPKWTARRVVARVEGIRIETPTVKSFTLRANGHFRGFRAGQHVNLTVEIDGVRHTRSYSPSNAPNGERIVVLTIKRHAAGLVSQWMHERCRLGSVVELGQAFGDFVLPADPGRLFLIAGGSGVTPIVSLLRDSCVRTGDRDVVLILYDRTYSDLIFADELRALRRDLPRVRVHFALTRAHPKGGDLSGRFCAEHVSRVAPDIGERHVFVCGPPTLLHDVRQFCKDRATPLSLKTETFTPLEVGSQNDFGTGLRVHAARTGRSFAATAATPLLVQAERAGLSPASGCRRGICFTCTCRKRSGTVRNLSTGLTSSEKDEDIRLCVTVPLSDVALDL